MKEKGRNLMEELMEEGIHLIMERGVEGFSNRAVAERCHVSCAAPFKHFKDRQDFFEKISEKLDGELMETMEELAAAWEGNHKMAHLAMCRAYILFLIQYPFLINQSFWRTIHEEQAIGIRSWKSFQRMIEEFNGYFDDIGMQEACRGRCYFSFQTFSYGAAFVVTSGLLKEQEKLEEYIAEIQRQICESIDREMMGAEMAADSAASV